MPQLFTNNATSLLFAALSVIDTTVTITPGDESLFPVPSPGDFFDLTIELGSTREIVRCTSVTANVFSIERGREGTVATAFSVGATIELRLTALWLANRSPMDVSNSENVTGSLDEPNGGTGQSSYTAGDILVATAVDTLTKLAAGAVDSMLQGNGGVPAWTTMPMIQQLLARTRVDIGDDASTTGALNLENDATVKARNNADNGDLEALRIDQSDDLRLAEGGMDVILPNNSILGARNNADNANISILRVDTNDIVRLLVSFILNNNIALSGRDSLDSLNIPLVKVDANDDIIIGNGLNQDIGIGENNPTARVHLGGSVGFAVREVSSNFSFGDDFFVAVDASGQNTTATLPALPAAEGRVYVIKRTDNNDPTTTLTVQTTGGDTIEDGVATTDTLTAQNEVKIYIGSTSEWKRIVG